MYSRGAFRAIQSRFSYINTTAPNKYIIRSRTSILHLTSKVPGTFRGRSELSDLFSSWYVQNKNQLHLVL